MWCLMSARSSNLESLFDSRLLHTHYAFFAAAASSTVLYTGNKFCSPATDTTAALCDDSAASANTFP